ncbi:LOW QUALITY PROTEIN: cyclin-dependent kinase 11A [Manduca sexta]|uniref:LOW QUALITY PROTEIN: cyclin-dependent kinase 11A n=1 Tax=Manduca sexta TaxID=7130 RepID=UPI0018903BF6|nr:LOW QUALITY PROTEIN: cyclin-dependent kinase 11A [Manduca sexta]
MMSNYEDDQSEDGELARSPVQDEMDFSLSDEDRDNADSLVIKPPQAVIRTSHREKRGHKRAGKDRYKDNSRKDKKHLFRERDKSEKLKREVGKNSDRDDMPKDYYREKQYYRDKEMYREKEAFRDKESYRDKEVYRDKDTYREKEVYRESKEAYREKDIREKEIYREREMREKDIYKEKEACREKDPYREREHYRERELYRDNNPTFRETIRARETYRDKDMQRDVYLSRERQYKYTDTERKRPETDRIESRLRLLAEESNHSSHNNEKENRDRSSGDKELEDLRSRLLSKRISKELQTQESRKNPDYGDKESKSDRHSSLDKHQQERRKRLIEAEREMEKRKHESRTELEARREERRRRGKKRSVSPTETTNKKTKTEQSPNYGDSVVTVSDASDVEMKSDSHSEPEDGEHSNTESEEESSTTDSDSAAESKSEEEDNHKDEQKLDKELEKDRSIEKPRPQSKSPTPKSGLRTPSSHRSHSRSKSRSRSHSFSPPPPGENGKTIEEEMPKEDDEKSRLREEAINALPPYYPALQGCRSVEEFQCLNRIEEGTYGVVYRARDKTTDEIVALKRLKMEKEKEGFPITSLREINTLLKGQHPNIVTVREIVVGSNMDKIFIVMDYVEHDLKSLMETMRGKKQVFLPGEVKCLMTQLLKAVHHLHDNWILHRDLKTSNLLLSHKGVLKVGDFGLAREYGSPLRQYTPIVVTLWYRAPELLLCCKEYSTPIDIWSVGCIFAEFITMNPLFPGKSEVDQLNRIFKDMGTPSELIWPGYNELPAVQKMTFADHPAGGLRQRIGSDLLSETGLSLLQGFLTYNPARRLTADAALEHAYFKEHPVAIDPAMFPTWPAKSEGNRRTHSPRPPAGGAAYAQYARADSDEALGFHVHQRSLNVAPGFSLKF